MKVNSALSGLKSRFNGTHGLCSRLRVKWGAKQLPAIDEGLHDEVSHCVEGRENELDTIQPYIYYNCTSEQKKAERCGTREFCLLLRETPAPRL